MQSNKNIIQFSSSDNLETIIKGSEPVIVDFYADWCGPCKKLGPILEKRCEDEKTFKLVKINVDQNKDLANEYNVSGIPHVILFFEGKEISNFKGFDPNSLNDMIEKTKTLCILIY